MAPNVHAIEGESLETEATVSMRENLPEYQSAHPDIGSIIGPKASPSDRTKSQLLNC